MVLRRVRMCKERHQVLTDQKLTDVMAQRSSKGGLSLLVLRQENGVGVSRSRKHAVVPRYESCDFGTPVIAAYSCAC